MEFRIKTDDLKNRKREYEIKGEISLQNVEPLVGELKNCLSKYDFISITLKQLTGFDTAAFQFFYSLKNSCVRDKKQLTIVADLNAETAKLLENNGIKDLSKVLSTTLD